MEIVEQLPAEFHVKLVAEGGDTLFDAIRLDLHVLLVVEPVFHIFEGVLNTGYKIKTFAGEKQLVSPANL